MKKACLAVFAILLLLPLGARAEKLELNMRNLDIGAMALVPAHFLRMFIHEQSHAAVARSYGASITKFVIWPEKIDGKIVLGYTEYIDFGRRSDIIPTDRQLALIAIAPVISDLIIFSATETAFALDGISYDSYLAPLIFLVGEVMPWIDFVQTAIISSDIREFEKRTGWSPTIIRSAGVVIAFAGGYLLVRRAGKIFLKPRGQKIKQKVRRGIALMPFADVGASISIQF